MARKTKGGMMRTISKPLTTAGITLGKSLGKDYLQKKSIKVVTGVYEDPSLATNTEFLLTAKKPIKKPTSNIYHTADKENMNPNLAGKSRKNKKSRKNIKRKKTRKNRK